MLSPRQMLEVTKPLFSQLVLLYWMALGQVMTWASWIGNGFENQVVLHLGEL
jgi:hypothetical protein